MSESAGLPAGVLIAFYGDDFTGSSAVMEVMTFAGLPAVMFVETPTPEQLERFRSYRAIGVAGVARAQRPGWMDAHLPGPFRALAGLKAPVTHYKICSTLDSSPAVGSVGRAIDIGAPIFSETPGAANWQPLVVAAPAIGRYQAFGNLFAASGDCVYRLDRHPVMRRHPVTPMDEADVRLHVGKQTSRAIGLVDFVAMKRGAGLQMFDAELEQGRSLLALDIVDDETLRWVGELMWRRRRQSLFAIGSQGVEYALVAHWRAEGWLPDRAGRHSASEHSQIVAVSGSVSPVSASQIEWAQTNGFDLIDFAAEASLDDRRCRAEIDAATERARATLSNGRSPLVATARGPNDEAVARFRAKLAASGCDPVEINARIGRALGEILRRVVGETRIRRAAVSGGDTSGFATGALGAYALEAIAPIAPGAPLCRAHSTDPRVDGIEIALKGGQMGEADFFGSVRAGRATTCGGTR
ncbi:MAG TPA: four-carbon acid sugar kinase family protein [Roseiarcus sp.]|nr:four-carbon acid sugar kinase family protein [Roseiarcus sp.]